MKNLTLYLLVLFILITGCKKEDLNPKIISGIDYSLFTDIIQSDCDVKIIINDSLVSFNKLKSYYADASGGNVFHIEFSNGTSNTLISIVEFDLYLPPMEVEDFFQHGEIFNIDIIQLWHRYPNFSGFGDFYSEANIVFKWDSVELTDRFFNGFGYIQLKEDIVSELDTICYFPQQIIDFNIQ
jgi:hypothetical protein